jgi:hypothetical protein
LCDESSAAEKQPFSHPAVFSPNLTRSAAGDTSQAIDQEDDASGDLGASLGIRAGVAALVFSKMEI